MSGAYHDASNKSEVFRALTSLHLVCAWFCSPRPGLTAVILLPMQSWKSQVSRPCTCRCSACGPSFSSCPQDSLLRVLVASTYPLTFFGSLCKCHCLRPRFLSIRSRKGSFASSATIYTLTLPEFLYPHIIT